MAQIQIQVELVVQRSQRRDVGLHGHVGVERRLRERMIAGACQAGLAGVGLVAAQPRGQHVADLQVLGLFRGTEGQEQLGVHAQRSGLQAEADQQRGALRQSGVDAPRAAAPCPARRLARRLGVAGGVEAIPCDVRLRIPVEALGLAVQLAERRHLRRELEREAPLDEPLLLRLVRAQQPRRVLARLAHPLVLRRPPRRRRWTVFPNARSQRLPGLSNFTFFALNSSGSNRPPSHRRVLSYSSCAGSRITAMRSSYPPTPPQSSGGHARSPARQRGYRLPFSCGTIASRVTSCSQPSPKSYSYLAAAPGWVKYLATGTSHPGRMGSSPSNASSSGMPMCTTASVPGLVIRKRCRW